MKDTSKEFILNDGQLVATSMPHMSDIDGEEWDALVKAQDEYNPFVSYVSATSGSHTHGHTHIHTRSDAA